MQTEQVSAAGSSEHLQPFTSTRSRTICGSFGAGDCTNAAIGGMIEPRIHGGLWLQCAVSASSSAKRRDQPQGPGRDQYISDAEGRQKARQVNHQRSESGLGGCWAVLKSRRRCHHRRCCSAFGLLCTRYAFTPLREAEAGATVGLWYMLLVVKRLAWREIVSSARHYPGPWQRNAAQWGRVQTGWQ